MSNTLKKIFRGLIAIFVIKITFVAGMLIFQSCSDDDSTKNISDISESNLFKSLSLTNDEISAIRVSGHTGHSRSNDFGEVIITKPTESEIIVENLGDIVEGIETGEFGIVTDEDCEKSDLECYTYILNEAEVEVALEPSIQAAKNYFYSLGLNDNDIIEVMDGDQREELLIATAIGIQIALGDGSDYALNSNSPEMILSVLGIQNANALSPQTENLYVNCFLEATGFTAGLAFFTALTDQATDGAIKAAAKKLFKKAGAKIAGGVIGLAITVAEFIWCINR